MSATLTKDSARVTMALRLASCLRARPPKRAHMAPHQEGVLRTRLAEDGSLVGRSVLTLPFDL